MKSNNTDRVDDDSEVAREPFPFAQGDIVWIEDDDGEDDEDATLLRSHA